MSLLVEASHGDVVYTLWRDKQTGKFAKASVNPAVMEVYQDGHWALYAVTDSEIGTSGNFTSIPPPGLPAAIYDAIHYKTSTSPALGDLFIGSDDVDWGGDSILLPTPSNPASPGLCRVFGYEVDGLSGNPVASRLATATITILPFETTGAIVEGKRQVKLSDVNGLWFFDCIQGATARFIIPECRVDKTILVPVQSTLDLRTMLP